MLSVLIGVLNFNTLPEIDNINDRFLNLVATKYKYLINYYLVTNF